MENTTNRPSGKSFSGDKRRLLEFAGVSHEDIERILAEKKDCCEKCDCDPCECAKEEEEEVKGKCKNCKCDPCECKEEQEEVKECACGCKPGKCKCSADCKKCSCNKKD